MSVLSTGERDGEWEVRSFWSEQIRLLMRHKFLCSGIIYSNGKSGTCRYAAVHWVSASANESWSQTHSFCLSSESYTAVAQSSGHSASISSVPLIVSLSADQELVPSIQIKPPMCSVWNRRSSVEIICVLHSLKSYACICMKFHKSC